MANEDPFPAPPMEKSRAPANQMRQSNAVIPREALERVLARAVELQTVHEELPDGISEARLAEIGREVGIDVNNLRQAMAEERARLPMSEEDHGPVLDALGAGTTSAQRTVPGSPEEIMEKLEAWMPRMELLAKQRRIGDRISWQPKRDPLGNLLHGLGMGGRQADLVRTDQVAAMVTSIDSARSVVRLEASMLGVRRTRRTVFALLAGGLVTAFALLAIPIMFLATPGPIPVIAIGVIGALFGGTGYGAWRAMKHGYRKMIGRAHLRLEQILDDLESGGMNMRPGLLNQVRDALLGK